MAYDDSNDGKVDLTPHRLAPTADDAANPETASLAQLIGFLGDSRNDALVRIYTDLSFETYYEVERKDIVRTARVDTREVDSPTIVWVKGSAQIAFVHVSRIEDRASYLTGDLRARHQMIDVQQKILAAHHSDIIVNCIHIPPGPLSSWCLSEGVPCPPPGSGTIFPCA